MNLKFFSPVAGFVIAMSCALARAADIELLDPVPLQREVVDALRNLTGSPYQTLKNQFEKAREPSDEQIRGAHGGRCFFSDRPMQAVAAFLTTETETGSDDGPAFKGPQFRKILPFVARKMPANYFSMLTPKIKADVHALEAKYRNDAAYPVRSNDSLRSFIPRSMTIQARSYEFRARGRYIVMKATCEDHGGCFNETQTWAFYYDNEDFAYCYFFRP